MPPTDVMAAASSTSTDADGATSGGRRTILPLNITEKIIRCISPLESAHLATVCQPWAATVSARLAGPFAPHLFLHMPPEHKSDRSGLIVPVSMDGSFRVRPLVAIPARVRKADTLGLDCIGATPSGPVPFLPYLSSGIVFLVNPVTGVSRWIDMRMPKGSPKQVLAAGAADGDQLQQFATPLTNLSDARLVESDGDILLVRRLVEFKELAVPTCEHNRLDLVVVGFKMYRLDVEDRRWSKVEKLAGDETIFMSPKSSFVVRASETAGCRSNCIYYVRKKRCCPLCHTDRGNTCWGVYSMEEQEVLFEPL